MRKLLIILAAAAALVVGWFWWHGMQHWLAVHTGTDNCPAGMTPDLLATCKYYGFWSGFGSDLGEVTVLGLIFAPLFAIWRTHTCHATWWCWRRPLHPVGDSPYKVCHVHHPDDVPSVGEALAAEAEAVSSGT